MGVDRGKYGNYVVLTEEPSEGIRKECIEKLKASIPKDLDVDWDTFEVTEHPPNSVRNPFDYIYDEQTGVGTKIWTIAISFETKQEANNA